MYSFSEGCNKRTWSGSYLEIEVIGMANVVTQMEICKYEGMHKAVFKEGTIITPAARDWAREHEIEIVLGNFPGDTKFPSKKQTTDYDKEKLLEIVIEAVNCNIENAGCLAKRDELIEAVIACLRKLGCKVDI
jgi:hypothetical protein